LINRTLLKDVNPMIKYGSGIILGGTLAIDRRKFKSVEENRF
jgi:hypothetical protein